MIVACGGSTPKKVEGSWIMRADENPEIDMGGKSCVFTFYDNETVDVRVLSDDNPNQYEFLKIMPTMVRKKEMMLYFPFLKGYKKVNYSIQGGKMIMAFDTHMVHLRKFDQGLPTLAYQPGGVIDAPGYINFQDALKPEPSKDLLDD
jgi:hypothetical protein